MVGLNIRYLFMFDWVFIIIVFKNMQYLNKDKYEINMLFFGEKGYFEGLELF